MFRLLGFLVGSVTSILIILMIIGLPKLHLGDDEQDQKRYDAAIEMLKAKQHEIESVTGRLSEDVARVAGNLESGPAPVAVQPADKDPASDPQLPGTGNAPGNVPAVEELAAEAEPQWYSFWNPFRSEIAASGFVAQLEKVTGIDYRVVKVRTGTYEVAFAYHDDAERRTKLAQISAATGLDLPES